LMSVLAMVLPFQPWTLIVSDFVDRHVPAVL